MCIFDQRTKILIYHNFFFTINLRILNKNYLRMPTKGTRPRPKSADFMEIGLRIMGRHDSRASDARLTLEFVNFFGCEPIYASILWYLLEKKQWLVHGFGILPCHLLWTLYFLKVYATEGVSERTLKCDPKTFREKVWFFLHGIARLDKILVSIYVLVLVYVYFHII